MTASERLCKLLDERGVEYERNPWSCGAAVWWRDSSGTMWRAHDNEEDELLSFYAYNSVTPEQAIAATLGSSNCTNGERTNDEQGTCKLERASWDDGTCTWGCICTACDAHLEHETGIGYNYCPICGARCVG